MKHLIFLPNYLLWAFDFLAIPLPTSWWETHQSQCCHFRPRPPANPDEKSWKYFGLPKPGLVAQMDVVCWITSFIISCSSASVGFWPRERITVASSWTNKCAQPTKQKIQSIKLCSFATLVVMVPSPSLSNRENASRYSEIWDTEVNLQKLHFLIQTRIYKKYSMKIACSVVSWCLAPILLDTTSEK